MLREDKLPRILRYKQTNYQGSIVTIIPITKVLRLQLDQVPMFWCYKQINYQGSYTTNKPIT